MKSIENNSEAIKAITGGYLVELETLPFFPDLPPIKPIAPIDPIYPIEPPKTPAPLM